MSQIQFWMQWSEPPKFERQMRMNGKLTPPKLNLAKITCSAKFLQPQNRHIRSTILKRTINGPNSKPWGKLLNGKKNNRTDQLQICMSEPFYLLFHASLACSSRVTISMGKCPGQIFSCSIAMLLIVKKPDFASSESCGRPWKGGPAYIHIQNINMYKHVPSVYVYRKYIHVSYVKNIHIWYMWQCAFIYYGLNKAHLLWNSTSSLKNRHESRNARLQLRPRCFCKFPVANGTWQVILWNGQSIRNSGWMLMIIHQPVFCWKGNCKSTNYTLWICFGVMSFGQLKKLLNKAH